MTKKRFYSFMVCVMIALLGRAICVSMDFNRRENLERLKFVETLSYEECARRYTALLKEFQIRPTSGNAYYTTLAHAYALEDIARKAMENPPPTWTAGKRRDFRIDDIVRSIPVEIQPQINEYGRDLNSIQDTQEFRDAGREFNKSKSNPLHRPEVYVPGGDRVLFWWIVFQFGPSILIAIHFCIRLQEQGQKILPEFGNPEFWFWILFWEVGIFRYPMKVSPAQQIRRLKQWGAFVFTSVLPCMAATSKTCEEKSQSAPQHQQYNSIWSRFSFTTSTLPKYIGLDGGNFFDAPVQQSTATISLPCGFFVGAFYSEPLGDRSLRPNFGRELDPYLGWRRTFGKYTFDTSFTYLFVSPIKQVPRGDVIQLSERLTWKVAFGNHRAFSPFVWLRQAVPVRGPTPIGGNFIHVGGTFAQNLKNHVSTSVTTDAVHDSGAFGYRKGYIGRLVGDVTWKTSHGLSFQIPQITFTDPISHTGDGRRQELTIGAGISFSPSH